MINKDIREKIANYFLPKWKVAETVGISNVQFSNWLRHELPPEKKAIVFAAIEKLIHEREEIYKISISKKI